MMGQSFFTKFKTCTKIEKCHVVKMSEQSENIEVAEYLGNALKSIKIMNNSILRGTCPIIVPKGLVENGLIELEFSKILCLKITSLILL